VKKGNLMVQPLIRDVLPSDLDAVLQLNEEFVHFLSPLDMDGLEALVDTAAYCRVAEVNGKIAAFLIALVSGADYNSVNYKWFEAKTDSFAYVDRVAVAAYAQGQALGVKLYDDLASFARAKGLIRLTCEYYCLPLNEASAKFHSRYGFEEVGQQALYEGEKWVSMQICPL